MKMKTYIKNRLFIRVFAAVCAAALLAGLFSGCGKTDTDGRLSVVATVFPEYDWVMNVVGEKASDIDVTQLLDSGADLHSYQPTVADIAKVSSCDLFIYVGGESDDWVDDALKNRINADMQVINLMEILGDEAKEEEVVEGMEADDHDHDHEEGEEEEEHDHVHEEAEYDEHVWLSLKSSQKFISAIAEAFGRIDPDNASLYTANAVAYNGKLDELDKRYEQAVEAASRKTVLFGDRFPFRYLVDDYGIEYYAAFVGCSAETEASFETIVFLAGKVDELGLPAILKIESSDGKLAETVKNNTASKDQKILTMDSLQSATSKEYAAGRTYLKIMEDNLAALTEALG